ncbi:hypothetical protein ACQZ61_21370 [Agrobacterium vitis]|uniref:hypothetical protein n=1 Tax=Rhizobium/Agrobacterium group TaxID=227290 RepID=UPI0008DBFA5D|nr:MULTISPECIES: hypothetical protein [Rhizobium/Agrobacterium group]MCF1450471.1 hypothetical protein [Allorhizobium ampelinum]MCF1455753.1 hypothetical protein [Agrobacterium vitis]MCF1479685.1 hypothetical protein [Agrobacterium vitis]MUO30945.1 hypothetical protein [Agrobacterium vitis]CAH0343553.1 hypothetical protein RHI9324_05290 [Rhizobium sp. CECT 9324]
MNLKILVAALPLFASGCAATLPPEVIASGDLADLPVDVRPVHYYSPVAGYTHRVPVDPKPWRNQNDAQAPDGGAS